MSHIVPANPSGHWQE